MTPDDALDFGTSLQVLRILSGALTEPHSLDAGLAHIARMTGELMAARQTVILLRDEERGELIVRTCVGIRSRNVRVGHPLVVPPRLKSILWRLRSLHQINGLEVGIEDLAFPILVNPIRVKGERVGLLVAGGLRTPLRGFDPIRRGLFALIAPFASLVIENAKVYDYLRQSFAQRSQDLIEANRREAADRDQTEHLMVSSLSNPNKVVRLLAESFYKELVRAGFTPGHITTAAAQILECITRGTPAPGQPRP
ncbi:MAG: hypothetical protein JXR77_17875 [Lentisphaeria bacterium]|nr:hypothetical protein [Lentisphaeria bacterium]